jgi:hypothetical protein
MLHGTGIIMHLYCRAEKHVSRDPVVSLTPHLVVWSTVGIS